jgi:hypothetical protein
MEKPGQPVTVVQTHNESPISRQAFTDHVGNVIFRPYAA